MRRVFMLSAMFALGGCGAFLSLSGDDEDDPPPPVAVPDASFEATNGDDATTSDGSSDGTVVLDSSVDAKTNADAGASLFVFVTSSQYAGDKLSSPDSICMAAKGSRTGTYRAWLSHSLRQAANVITGDGPWRLFDGKIVAANKAQLLSGQLTHAIDIDENGNVPSSVDSNVWTGTSEQGTTLFHCNQWKQADGGLQGTYGSRNALAAGWTNAGQVSCLSTLRLYCFQIPE